MSVPLYCISAGRAQNVPTVRLRFSPQTVTFVVPEREKLDYRGCGAERVIAVPEPGPLGGTRRYGLTVARNVALQDAAGPSFQTSDDLKGFKRHDNAIVTWPTVRAAMLAATGTAGYVGLPPTANTFFTKPGIKDHVFIIGDLFYSDGTVQFDETLPLKEDYDYTCRHLERYGKVARVGDYVALYQHYSNRGGAVRYRTDALEHEVTARLLARWPDYLRPHPRRPHELIVGRRSAPVKAH